MSLFFDYTLDGVANGMVYAALALALVLIYRATRIINFAQGAAGMLTTFIAFSLLSAGLGLLVGLHRWCCSIGFAIGAVTERVLIRPLHGKSELNPVIVTIGLSSSSRAWPGRSTATPAAASRLPSPRAASGWGPRRSPSPTSTCSSSSPCSPSWPARSCCSASPPRACACGPRPSPARSPRLLGVRVGLLLTLGWGLAGIAGSLAGLLVAPTSSFGPYYMDLILVYGFTAAVIGGLESPVGALVGGLISGLCISYVGGYLGSGLEPLGALALLMVALMARPEGIFSRPPARRV